MGLNALEKAVNSKFRKAPALYRLAPKIQANKAAIFATLCSICWTKLSNLQATPSKL